MKTSKHSSRGFTLTEVIVASFISAIVMAGTVAVVIQSVKSYYYESDKILISGEMRRLSADMVEMGSYCSDMAIAPSYASVSTAVSVGSWGNCLVFMNRAADGTGNIQSLTCYYMAPLVTSAPNGEQVLKRISGTVTSTTNDIATAVANVAAANPARQVSGVIRTSITSTTPAELFLNDGGKIPGRESVVISLPVTRNSTTASTTATGLVQNAKSNFSFAISPRR
jgi:prepilin-type N-terminal cleavage/methylation domain-containing protein